MKSRLRVAVTTTKEVVVEPVVAVEDQEAEDAPRVVAAEVAAEAEEDDTARTVANPTPQRTAVGRVRKETKATLGVGMRKRTEDGARISAMNSQTSYIIPWFQYRRLKQVLLLDCPLLLVLLEDVGVLR
jgi:hypothetical protein